MFCFSCGAKVEDGAVFCDKCGALMTDGPDNLQKQVGKITNDQPAQKSNASAPGQEPLKAAGPSPSGSKRPWATSGSSASVSTNADAVRAAERTQSFEPPSLRGEASDNDGQAPSWGRRSSVEVVSPSSVSETNSAQATPPAQPMTSDEQKTSGQTGAFSGVAGQKQTEGSPLKGKAIYIALAALVVAVIILLVALLGRSCTSTNNQTPNQTGGSSSTQGISEAYEDEDEMPSVSISFDDSKPFWGVWTSASQSESSAQDYASSLTKDGYKSNVVVSTDWENLNSDTWYYVTTGSWDTESEAEEMVSILKKAGYSDAYSKYTGEYLDGENTVMLTVVSAGGKTLSGKVHRDSNDYVIADSSSKEYSVSSIRAMNLTDAELCIAWNEPFARLGYHFKNPDVRAYFESCSWYHDSGWSGSLSGAAAANNSNIREVAGDGCEWKDLATS